MYYYLIRMRCNCCQSTILFEQSEMESVRFLQYNRPYRMVCSECGGDMEEEED